MKSNIISIRDFKPKFSEKFFLDTNVWMYLFYPQNSSISKKKIQEYSTLFEFIVDRAFLIESNIVQISEIINLFVKLEFDDFKKKNPSSLSLKDYRDSEEGNETRKKAEILVKSIARVATIRSGNLSDSDIQNIVSKINKADFNDICFAFHCNKEKATLLTHDFDFGAIEGDFTIVSGNEKYFK
jgi:predicted nucleic acid-binding protein